MSDKYPLSRKMRRIIEVSGLFIERDVDKLTPSAIEALNTKSVPSSRSVRKHLFKPARKISKTTYIIPVNEGAITGGGTLRVGELDDISLYDNGIEYVEVDGTRAPDHYDRYQFTHDPAAAVDVIYFIGELSNINNGTCDITVEN